MRKLVPILVALTMTLILGLAPSFSVIPADAFSGLYGFSGKVNESRLPACCRRKGTHHCAMGNLVNTTSSADSSNPGLAVIGTTGTCPFSPKAQASAVLTFVAILLLALMASGSGPERFRVFASDGARAAERQRGWPKRGPPAAQLL